jgi:hypothetical protein
MISLKSFIIAIHDALINASDTLMNANVALLDKYFIETPGTTADPISGELRDKKTLVPRTVTLEYPHITAAGQLESLEVSVPLITLVPFTMAHVEKAKFTASFEMEVVNGELQLNFANKHTGGFFRKKLKTGNLEITLTPQDTPEGLRLLVEGYDAILKRQIS